MMSLFKHTGMVEGEDTYTAAVDKIRADIKGQTNQALERFKLPANVTGWPGICSVVSKH